MSINSDKKLQVTLSQPTFSYEAIARACGTSIVTKTGEKYVVEILEVKTAGEVTVSHTPVSGSVKAYKADGTAFVTSTVTANKVTITGAVIGDKVKVIYKTTLAANCEAIEISAKTFPKNVELELQTVAVNNAEEEIANVVISLPESKPSADWSLGKASERNASDQQMVFDIIAAADGHMGTMFFEPITTTP